MVPPAPQSLLHRSPEHDYFTLPTRETLSTATPTRYRPSFGSPASPNPGPTPGPGSSSYKTSGWSQILNPSSISLRGAVSRDKTNDSGFTRLPMSTSFEETTSPTTPGFAIPVPKRESPRKLRTGSRTSLSALNSSGNNNNNNNLPGSISGNSPPQVGLTPLRSSGGHTSGSGGGVLSMERSYGSSIDLRSHHKVSFGSASPLRRNFSRGMISVASAGEKTNNKRKTTTCSVRIDLPSDDE